MALKKRNKNFRLEHSVPKNRSTLLYPPLLAEIFRLIDPNICVPYLFLLKQIFSAIMIFSSTFSRQQHFFKVLTSLKRGENWIWRKELFKFWMCFQKIIFFLTKLLVAGRFGFESKKKFGGNS